MSELAKKIVVRRSGGDGKLGRYEFTIDGEPFPWHVSDSGFQVHVPGKWAGPGVTFTLMAEHVEVVHALLPEPQESE